MIELRWLIRPARCDDRVDDHNEKVLQMRITTNHPAIKGKTDWYDVPEVEE